MKNFIKILGPLLTAPRPIAYTLTNVKKLILLLGIGAVIPLSGCCTVRHSTVGERIADLEMENAALRAANAYLLESKQTGGTEEWKITITLPR